MKERRRPSDLNVETRGVGVPCMGVGTERLEVMVTVSGVCAFSVGDGGKTNKV